VNETPTACEQHSPLLNDPRILAQVQSIVDSFPEGKSRWLVQPPDHPNALWRQRLSRERDKIARLLGIRARGSRRSYFVAKELFMASLCGKLPKELSG
jgi:hypothetical protein